MDIVRTPVRSLRLLGLGLALLALGGLAACGGTRTGTPADLAMPGDPLDLATVFDGSPPDTAMPDDASEPPADAASPSDLGPITTTQINGTVTGDTLDPQGAITVSDDQFAGNHPGAYVVIVNVANYCAVSKADEEHPNSISLVVNLQQTDASGAYVTPTPGDYTVVPWGTVPTNTRFAVLGFNRTDGACMALAGHGGAATSGVVHAVLVGTSSGEVQASFDVMFGGDRLYGTFDVLYCNTTLKGSFTCT